jgi:hypothetical protein
LTSIRFIDKNVIANSINMNKKYKAHYILTNDINNDSVQENIIQILQEENSQLKKKLEFTEKLLSLLPLKLSVFNPKTNKFKFGSESFIKAHLPAYSQDATEDGGFRIEGVNTKNTINMYFNIEEKETVQNKLKSHKYHYLKGHPIVSKTRNKGKVALYFNELDEETWVALESPLQPIYNMARGSFGYESLDRFIEGFNLQAKLIDCLALTLDFAGYTEFCTSHTPEEIAFADQHTIGSLYQLMQTYFGEEGRIKLEGDCIKVYQPVTKDNYDSMLLKFIQALKIFQSSMIENDELIKTKIGSWKSLGFRCAISYGQVLQNYYLAVVDDQIHIACDLNGDILAQSAKGQNHSVINYSYDKQVSILITTPVKEILEKDNIKHNSKYNLKYNLSNQIVTNKDILDKVGCFILSLD